VFKDIWSLKNGTVLNLAPFHDILLIRGSEPKLRKVPARFNLRHIVHPPFDEIVTHKRSMISMSGCN